MAKCCAKLNGYELKDATARKQASENAARANELAAKFENEKTMMEQQLAAQAKRMDAFTALPGGSTAGDAELRDLRIGYDGTEYGSAGNAVRSQISTLHKILMDGDGEIVEDIATEETLQIVRSTSYPDLTTFAYTETQNETNQGYCIVKPGEIKGGVLDVDWDVSYGTFDVNLYLFDSNGNPYRHTYQANNSNATGFKGELFEPTYANPGKGDGYSIALEPFSVKIPEGCTCMLSLRKSYSFTDKIPDGKTFANWALGGGITFKVSLPKESAKMFGTAFVMKKQGVECANMCLMTDEFGNVVAGNYVDKATAAKVEALDDTVKMLTDPDALNYEESLKVVKTTSYPDLTTFAYTETQNDTNQGFCVAKPGEIRGGVLEVSWDTSYVANFNCNLYLFDSNGNPYLHTYAQQPWLGEELCEPVYAAPGDGSGYNYAINGFFSVKIPEGCTCMLSMRKVAAEGGFGSITTPQEFANWAVGGGIKFKVKKAVENSLPYVQKSWEEDNAGKPLVVGDDGIVTVKNHAAEINPNVNSVNHRGYKTAPENTLAAYRLSKKKGFRMVECDVSITADGVPVLLHDDTIDRTSNGSGKITELTLSQVRQYDFGSWKNAAYAGEQIPTFVEFIALCRNIGLHPYIELKSSANFTQNTVSNLVNIVKKYGMKKNVSWISFSAGLLEYVRNADGAARIGLVVDGVSSSVISNAAALKNGINEVFIDCCENISNSLAQECANADIPVEIWGIDTNAKVIAADPYVSGFTTDSVVAGAVLYDNAR